MSSAPNGHDTSEHPFLSPRHIDDLKGAVQSLTRNVSQLVEAAKAQTTATKLLEQAVTRLTDTLTAGSLAGDTPGGRRSKPKEK